MASEERKASPRLMQRQCEVMADVCATSRAAARIWQLQSIARISLALIGTSTSNISVGQEIPAEGDVAPQRAPLSVQVSSGATATYSDNVAPSSGKNESSLVVRLQPSIHAQMQSSRGSGTLDIGVDHYMYANDNGLDHTETPLRGTGSLELVDRWLYVDAAASIATQTRSVFGTQVADDDVQAGNRVRTRSFQIAPRIAGMIGGKADYELRIAQAWSKSNEGALARGSGARTTQLAGKVAGDTTFSWVGWSVLVENSHAGLQGVEDSENGRILANATVRFDPQFRIELSAGHEFDNFSRESQRNRAVVGAGLDWAPTERTKLHYRWDTRSFGNSYSFDFSHRTAMTSWTLQTGKGVRLPTQSLSGINGKSAFDALYAQLAGSIPDPFQRAEAVRDRLDLAGVPANASVSGNFLSSDPYLESRTSSSIAWVGAQNTVLFGATAAKSQRLGSLGSVFDDFSLSGVIRQRGSNASWSYSLSPQSSITLSGINSRSKGAAGQSSNLKTWTAGYRAKVGQRTAAGVVLRSTTSDSSTGVDYTENALTGTVSVVF